MLDFHLGDLLSIEFSFVHLVLLLVGSFTLRRLLFSSSSSSASSSSSSNKNQDKHQPHKQRQQQHVQSSTRVPPAHIKQPVPHIRSRDTNKAAAAGTTIAPSSSSAA